MKARATFEDVAQAAFALEALGVYIMVTTAIRAGHVHLFTAQMEEVFQAKGALRFDLAQAYLAGMAQGIRRVRCAKP